MDLAPWCYKWHGICKEQDQEQHKILLLTQVLLIKFQPPLLSSLQISYLSLKNDHKNLNLDLVKPRHGGVLVGQVANSVTRRTEKIQTTIKKYKKYKIQIKKRKIKKYKIIITKSGCKQRDKANREQGYDNYRNDNYNDDHRALLISFFWSLKFNEIKIKN